MVIEGDNHTITNNLAASGMWPGHYNNRREPKNFNFEANFEFHKAGKLTVKSNIVCSSIHVLYLLFQ